MKLLVCGGEQNKAAVWKNEWNHYNKAVMLELDWDTGVFRNILEYISPRECIASEKANIVFKAGSFYKDRLYLCTQTEVLIYSYPRLSLIERISYPFFNDLHHVAKINGQLVVVSTGLDMVIIFDKTNKPKQFLNVLGKDPWHRFSKTVDYRKFETTKPHESHPNYVFENDGELWVSRFEQKDAVCLKDIARRINIATERVHDGIVYGDHIFFTTVNGTVQVVNRKTLKVDEVYDLNELCDKKNPLGWCRGLCVENNMIFVGFSSLRSTQIRENLAWVRRGFKGNVDEMRAKPTRIVGYDMNSRSISKEINVDKNGLSAIFSIHNVY